MTDRYIPQLKPLKEEDKEKSVSLVDLQDELRKAWEAIHQLKGRLGTIELEDSVTVAGDLSATGALNATGQLSWKDFLTIGTRPLTPSTGASAPDLSLSGTSRIYMDLVTNTVKISQNGAAYTDLLVSPATLTTAVVSNSAGQTIATGGADKVLAFDTEVYDDGGYHDNAVNNSRLTVPAAGVYCFSGNVAWDTNGTGSRFLGIRLNGATVAYVSNLADGTNGNYQSITITRLMALGDYMELVVYQDSGANRTVANSARFSVFLVKAT